MPILACDKQSGSELEHHIYSVRKARSTGRVPVAPDLADDPDRAVLPTAPGRERERDGVDRAWARRPQIIDLQRLKAIDNKSDRADLLGLR
jgi:hypothetical protein